MADTIKTSAPYVVFQECPGEVALAFSCYGCSLACPGCHRENLWDENNGTPLSDIEFKQQLKKYQGLITAVVFFGGEWQVFDLQSKLKIARQFHLKTCLYTGLQHISRHLRPHLDFVKTGPWIAHRGGLENPASNQAYWRLEDGEIAENLNHLFHQ